MTSYRYQFDNTPMDFYKVNNSILPLTYKPGWNRAGMLVNFMMSRMYLLQGAENI